MADKEKKEKKAAEREAAKETTAENAKAEAPETAEKAGSPEAKKLAELEQQLKKLEDELKKEKELEMRVRAEYDNYRKRTAKEMGDISAEVKAKTVADVLPVADNIERALSVEGSDTDLRKGLQMIQQQIVNAFTKLEIEAIDSENVPFDPSVHNAVMHVEDESLGENTVIQVLQKGYKIGSKVLRYAMVKVAN